ncbi:MAG: molybdopterin molybdenumtransferase MoeA [Rhodanobacter sp.]|nr:MAG: molybdopterin molybdenumtransferase MoeA [Rhodanobacter sp.]TAM39114.1 MAG: molybdopterin molybdenumtransferase MoeA [Rhodanobacter sp.]
MPPDPGGRRRSGPGLSLQDARARLLAHLTPITMVERVGLREALGRVLGEDIVAQTNVPAHTNSAMDGYAVRGTDLPAADEVALRVVGEAFAGHPFAGEVGAGESVRIMTGAVMPRGADTVVIQEDVTEHAGEARIGSGHRLGQHVRKAGEDLARGTQVLNAGRRLTAADLGLVASLGVPEVSVYRRLRVAFFSTGDELRSLGEPLGEGDIYDSNRYTLRGMLTRFGADVLDLGVVGDSREALRAAFERAGANADVVMTSGGVSVGAADFVHDILKEAGEIGFWKVNIKPGHPVAFGRLHGGATFFGVPGNPVSTMVTYYQIVQPALDYLAGAEVRQKLSLRARTSEPLRKAPGRCEFQRGCLEQGEDGELVVRAAAPQGSGILRSMSLANCFIVLPEHSGPVAAGEQVSVEPFAGLI